MHSMFRGIELKTHVWFFLRPKIYLLLEFVLKYKVFHVVYMLRFDEIY